MNGLIFIGVLSPILLLIARCRTARARQFAKGRRFRRRTRWLRTSEAAARTSA